MVFLGLTVTNSLVTWEEGDIWRIKVTRLKCSQASKLGLPGSRERLEHHPPPPPALLPLLDWKPETLTLASPALPLSSRQTVPSFGCTAHSSFYPPTTAIAIITDKEWLNLCSFYSRHQGYNNEKESILLLSGAMEALDNPSKHIA